MSENHDHSNDREPNSLPPLSYGDYREYRRLLRMLDVQQHLNLSAHLYSSYLISRLTRNKLPHRTWTAWPLEDAPVPPQILDDYPSSFPGPVEPKQIKMLHRRASQTYPVPPDPDTDAPQVLLRACEAGLRRIVHRRIQNEKTLDIEAVLEPEPELGGALSQAIISTVDKYITRAPEVAGKDRLVSWQHLGIEGPARKRLKRLFNRDLHDYNEHIDDTITSGASDSSDPEDDEDTTSDRRHASSVGSNNGSGFIAANTGTSTGAPSSDISGDSDSETGSSRTGYTGSEDDSGSESDLSENDSDASDSSDSDNPSDLSDTSTSSAEA